MDSEALILIIAFFAISVLYMNLNYKTWAKNYHKGEFLFNQTCRLVFGLIVSFVGFYVFLIAITPLNVIAYHSIGIFLFQAITFMATSDSKKSEAESNVNNYISIGICIVSVVIAIAFWGQFLILPGATYDHVEPSVNITDNLIIVSTSDMNIVTERTAMRDAKISLANFDNTSRYRNGDLYKQEVNGEKIWVSPVDYSDFFRSLGNDKYLPGYITMDVSTNKKVNVVKDMQMIYSPGAPFNNELYRYAHFNYPNVLLYKASFELDDEGNAFWVVPYGNYKYFLQLEVVHGVIIVDPTTGETAQYPIGSIPQWVNTVFPANIAEDYCNYYGENSVGDGIMAWINKQVWPSTQFTLTNWTWDGSGDDAWSIIFDETGQKWYVSDTTRYSGSERTMVGYIMMSARTGEIKYNPNIIGINGNGICQNFKQPYKEKSGWILAEPTLYSIDSIPTWFSVIIDENGEIQIYCFGTIEGEFATDVSFAKALSKYRTLINSKGTVYTPTEQTSSLEISGTVYRVNTLGDNTYIIISTNKELVISVPDYVSQLAKMTLAGDSVTINYSMFEEQEAVANTFNVLMK